MASGMFVYPFNSIFIYSLTIYAFGGVVTFYREKSSFLFYILISSLIIFLIVLIQDYQGLYNDLNIYRLSLESKSISAQADNILFTTFKVLVKVLILFLILPIDRKYYFYISKYIKIFIYLTLAQVLLSTIIYNFLNINIEAVRNLFPLLSDFRTEVETHPFIFLDNVIKGIGSINYERPIGIFGEATALGNFILGIYIINLLIIKKVDYILTFVVLLIFIISICKAALVTFGISFVIYFCCRIIKNKMLAVLLAAFFGFLWWQLLLVIGTGYIQVRTLSTTMIFSYSDLLPNGFNAASWFMGYKYNLMANLGFVSMFYDLGIIFTIIFYLFLFIILIKIMNINNYKNFSLYLLTYTYFIYSLLINNIYYSGLFILLTYFFYHSLQKEISYK